MSEDIGINVVEALSREIERNVKLVEIYKTIPTGVFASTMIQEDIKKAHKALGSGDLIEILNSLDTLKGNKE